MVSSTKRYIYLKITDDGLFYNDRHYFKWNQTNFPSKLDFAWREHHPVYWKVELLNYDKSNKILDVHIEDYNETNLELFYKQKSKDAVREIHFHELKWSILQGQLRSYVYRSFMHLEGDEPVVPSIVEEPLGEIHTARPKAGVEVEEEPVVSEIAILFKTDILNLSFKSGFAECLHYVPEIDESLNIRLYNDSLLPQFDHIKPYFKKYFKNKQLQIRGKAVRQDDGVWWTKCRCQQISMIDEDAIASIRRMVLKDKMAKPFVIDVDKSLFTSDDIFLEENEIDLGKALRAEDLDLVQEIMDLKGVRNRKQLIYLSGKVQHDNTAIRFTLAPQFGFLFYAKGQEMCHFIWELIDSHATYIWSTDLDPRLLDRQFKAVEQLVNVIRASGRRVYLADKSDEDLLFHRISHQKANSTIVDPFPLWKARLDERLI